MDCLPDEPGPGETPTASVNKEMGSNYRYMEATTLNSPVEQLEILKFRHIDDDETQEAKRKRPKT